MLHFTDKQVARVETALTAFALARGASEADLELSRVRLGEGTALTEHVHTVERALGPYADLTPNVQNVLEAARATAGALASTVEFHEWNDLDRTVWNVVKRAR